MKLNHKYLFIATSMVMIFAQSVQADDGKSYPGSMCTKYEGSGTDVTSIAGMRNNSATSDLKVICPIVKDQNGIKSVSMHTIDPGGGAISCRVLTHIRENGAWKGQWTTPKSSGNGDPSFINFNNVNQDGGAGKHSYIRCTIPHKLNDGSGFHIISYHVIEWG